MFLLLAAAVDSFGPANQALPEFIRITLPAGVVKRAALDWPLTLFTDHFVLVVLVSAVSHLGMRGDVTIYELRDGKFKQVSQPARPDRNNFVIVCDYGDWSGFRTLAECEKQFPDIEALGRPERFFSVVER